MSRLDRSDVLALVRDRSTVTLEFLCQRLTHRSVEDISTELIAEIHTTLLEAGWNHSRRVVDGKSRVDVYERPLQDVTPPPAIAFSTSASQTNIGHAAPVTAITILHDASQAILQRAATRDLQAERSMARSVAAFNALSGQCLSERDGWLFMAILKAARATAGAHNGDDYIDGAAYFALAGETAEREAQRA